MLTLLLRISVFILLFFQGVTSVAQPPSKRMTKEEYIERYRNEVIKDMQKTGVPASITMAQGILESESGNSDLAVIANNHFGIKCHVEWNGDTFIKDDDEKNECFRKYKSAQESFDDHSMFLRTRKHYASLFDLPRTDYKAWAHGLKKAGYATNPNYAPLLIKIIEDYKLYELDKHYTTPIVVTKKNTEKPKQEVKEAEVTVISKILTSKNNVKYIIADENDTYLKIAKKFEMGLWQLYKYNDVNKNMPIKKGQRIYLKPKKRKASEEFHIVKAGESMHSISQLHAIKLKILYKKNQMEPGTEPEIGQKLYLKSKIKK